MFPQELAFVIVSLVAAEREFGEVEDAQASGVDFVLGSQLQTETVVGFGGGRDHLGVGDESAPADLTFLSIKRVAHYIRVDLALYPPKQMAVQRTGRGLRRPLRSVAANFHYAVRSSVLDHSIIAKLSSDFRSITTLAVYC